MHRLLCIGVLLATVGACKKSDPSAPPCAAVGANFIAIVHTNTSKITLDARTQRGLDAQLPAMRDSLVTQCTEGGWSADVRRCLAAATDHLAFERCEEHLSDAQRQRLTSQTK